MGVSGEIYNTTELLGGRGLGVGQGLVMGGASLLPTPCPVWRGDSHSSLSPKRGNGLEDAACRTRTRSRPVLHRDVLGFCSPGPAPGQGGSLDSKPGAAPGNGTLLEGPSSPASLA